ncbi:VWA domain-containing protein [Actinoplanes italicus]|uniref:VWFA domain-containing protein n=1 Tax=Actinoplanes italicus TaxID=113567 RepID=A0A2T0KME9_9ACTN|nr:VWA domain-containing protein [Actinoplanes italicus]PRX24647.1 hypothetical protein CLV67_102425 [Actinoplanes italicus]GIE27624.1 VWA domain-containing protein [Actinoplanes italicus]
MITAERALAGGLTAFAERLRAAGMVVEFSRLQAAAEALISASLLELPGPYWPLRLTLCGRRSDLAVFDMVYRDWTAPPEQPGDEPLVEVIMPAGTVAATEAGAAQTITGTSGSSYSAELAARDMRTLSDTEKQQVAALVTRLRPVGRPRRVARRVSDGSGRVDVPRSVRPMLRNGGEPTRLRWCRRDVRPRRLLFLIDVSKSMTPYVDMYLLFAHAALVAGPGITEVFTVGTCATQITAQLAAPDPQEAMSRATEVEADWQQGTRLGHSLRSFLRRWSGNRLLRSSVVVICSDGMEEDRDPGLLPRQVARLSRIAHRVIWVNPASRRKNFRPMLPLRDSLRYADRELIGHTLNEVHALVEAIKG